MKERIKSIDFIRTISILAVILIHTTTRTLESSDFNLSAFPVTLFLNQIARFAVPLFILISGFVLEISYDSSLGYFSFLKKRFGRIFIPYLFWSILYYFFIYNQNHDNFLRVILTGNASYQLYFIPTLCIFYLAFPFLHKAYKFISNKIVLLILLTSQLWFLNHDYFVKAYKFEDPLHIAILSYFFFIIGIVAARNKEKISLFMSKWKYLILPGGLISGIYVYLEGIGRYYLTDNYLSYYSQWRPSVLIYVVLVGIALYYLFGKPLIQFSILEKMSKFSFLVFLLHVIVLEGVWLLFGKNLFNQISESLTGKVIFDLLLFGVVAGVSFTASYLLHKIPKLNSLTG